MMANGEASSKYDASLVGQFACQGTSKPKSLFPAFWPIVNLRERMKDGAAEGGSTNYVRSSN
jgi:hypothetical protein